MTYNLKYLEQVSRKHEWKRLAEVSCNNQADPKTSKNHSACKFHRFLEDHGFEQFITTFPAGWSPQKVVKSNGILPKMALNSIAILAQALAQIATMGKKGDGKSGGKKGSGKTSNAKGVKPGTYIKDGVILKNSQKKEEEHSEELDEQKDVPMKKRKRSRPAKKEKKEKAEKEEPADTGEFRRRDRPKSRPEPVGPEFSVDYLSHYPGMAAVFPSLALILAALSDGVISVLSAGKRSDKQKISALPIVLAMSTYFSVVLMANSARYSVSRIIGIDQAFETGEKILPELMPMMRFIYSVNICGRLQHMLGQFRTPDGILVTQLGRPFVESPIKDLTDQEVNSVDWSKAEDIEDLLDFASFDEDGARFVYQRIRWLHEMRLWLSLSGDAIWTMIRLMKLWT